MEFHLWNTSNLSQLTLSALVDFRLVSVLHLKVKSLPFIQKAEAAIGCATFESKTSSRNTCEVA